MGTFYSSSCPCGLHSFTHQRSCARVPHTFTNRLNLPSGRSSTGSPSSAAPTRSPFFHVGRTQEILHVSERLVSYIITPHAIPWFLCWLKNNATSGSRIFTPKHSKSDHCLAHPVAPFGTSSFSVSFPRTCRPLAIHQGKPQFAR